MEDLLLFIQAHVPYAPYLIFGALLLAGFNIPVSEDAMIFISAVLSKNYPQYFIPLVIGLYLGIYLSDLISYWLGRILGEKLFKIRFFANMASPKQIAKVHHFYQKYGMVTILIGRFIPFGVRNGLFLTAGLGKMKFIKFALVDFIASSISTVVYFSLYYHYGNAVIFYVQESNAVIFSVALFIVLILYIRKKWRLKKAKQNK
jgi:membrane-associated protein